MSCHATEGTEGPATFALKLLINGKQAIALVDSGSSDTFMSSTFAASSNCYQKPMAPKKVTVAGGGTLVTANIISQTNFHIQGKTFSSTFKVLDLTSYDVILGADWICKYSPICLDLVERILVVTKNGAPITLYDYTIPKKKCLISAMKLEKMLKKGVMGYILQTHLEEVEEKIATPSVPAELQPLLEKYKDVFAESESLPPSRECDHKIHLKPGSNPPNLRPYKVPHYQKAAMEEIIKTMLEKCQIQPSLSPFSSPAVMVRKKDGGWRLCVDYRELNSITIKNKFPMPVIEDLIDELHGATVFTKLDLRFGYHQIKMAPEDIHKTAFKTHMGHYEYTVVPFGLTNAPATFQELMNVIFGPHLRKFIVVFFDDILIFSMLLLEHMEHLEEALKILRENQLSVKLSKCEFVVPKISYLGHVISAEGVATDPSKIQDVLD